MGEPQLAPVALSLKLGQLVESAFGKAALLFPRTPPVC